MVLLQWLHSQSPRQWLWEGACCWVRRRKVYVLEFRGTWPENYQLWAFIINEVRWVEACCEIQSALQIIVIMGRKQQNHCIHHCYWDEEALTPSTYPETALLLLSFHLGCFWFILTKAMQVNKNGGTETFKHCPEPIPFAGVTCSESYYKINDISHVYLQN